MLFVTHRFPYPFVNHAGGVYVFDLIKTLSKKGFVIDLLSFINDDEIKHVSRMREYCENIEVIPSKKKLIEYILNLPLYFFKPKFIVLSFQRCFVNKLKKLQRDNIYNVIQFEWTPMCQYVNYVQKNTVKILREHDVSIIPVEREFYKQTKLLQKIKKWWTLRLLRQYEPKFCKKFDLVLTFSKKDSDFLKKINPHINTYINPLFVKTVNEISAPPPNKKILFLAHLGRPPNIEAVEWFYKNVFIYIHKMYPDAIFTIVGAEPHKIILEIAKNENVQLFANVENPEDFYKDARVFVSPLFVGGGIIKKNLDAMGMGCPLITTSIGNEGIEGIDGRDVLIADSREEFINKLNIILNDDNYWRIISENERTFIKTNFNFDDGINKLIEQYNLLIKK